MNQPTRTIIARVVLATFISASTFGQSAWAAESTASMITSCKNRQQENQKATQGLAKNWLQDDFLVAVGKQKVEPPWSGIPFSNCLDLLPSGFSLTLTIPTLEMILEQIIKMIAQKICDVIRGTIRDTVGQLTDGLGGSFSYNPTIPGLGSISGVGASANPSYGGMKAGSGVVGGSSTYIAPTVKAYGNLVGKSPASSALPGVAPAAAPVPGISLSNPAAPLPNRAASGVVAPPVASAPSNASAGDDGILNKAKCLFGGASCPK